MQPFVELAKQITDSPICEIEIIDDDYQSILAHNVTGVKVAPQYYSVCNETLQKNVAHEIEDLSKQNLYKNLSYVKGNPWLRYYFGIKLTTSTGKDIGTISVLDSIPKRIAIEQKVQFKLLAHTIMLAIESEYGFNKMSDKLNMLKDNLHKLNHYISSPISGIILLADLLMEDKEEVKVQSRDIKMFKESAQAISDIITGILATEDVDINIEKMLEKKPLSEVLKKLEGLYNPLAQDKNVTLSLKYQMDGEIRLPYYISIKLIRIIGNLVSNAIKFSPRNGSVDVIFSGTFEEGRTMINITVKDTGESLSSEQISSFKNGNPVARSNEHGSKESFGLGLQHVYQMISEEGGSVTVEARKGSGTRFSISLPLPADESYINKNSVPLDLNSFEKPTFNGNKQ